MQDTSEGILILKRRGLRVTVQAQANLKGNGHGPVLDQLQLHGLLAAASVEAAHVAVLGRVDAPAARRDGALGVSPGVREARLVHDAEVLHVLSNQVGEAAVAAWRRRTRQGRRVLKCI